MLYSWDRAEHMRQLHAQGRYKGTSKIGLWNISEEKRKRMEIIRAKNALDKTSTGYGSERYLRTINYQLFLLILQHGNKETAKNIKAPHERVERNLSKRNKIKW